jgi:small multidrug resistance pump
MAELRGIMSVSPDRSRMNPYALLGAAIFAELAGTTLLKLSQGFSKPLPSLGVIVGYGVSFYLLSLVLEDLPVGLVYGTWSAVGIIGIAAVGIVLFDETLDFAAVAGIALIVVGVLVLNLVSNVSAH